MKHRNLVFIERDYDGKLLVYRAEIPANPQTLTVRVRKGQQVCIEIEEDNTKSRKRATKDANNGN